jgi:hypothetical protein
VSLRPVVRWRIVAGALWIISIACLIKALGDGATAEESLYNPHLTDVDRMAIAHLGRLADYWNWAGWSLQAAVAVALSRGIDSERIARRIFASLGILIGVDGVLLLLMAVLIP